MSDDNVYGNDCWNSVSCCRKADNELADVTLSGRLFQNCAAATGNARPPTVDSLNGGIIGCRAFPVAAAQFRLSEFRISLLQRAEINEFRLTKIGNMDFQVSITDYNGDMNF